jgi:hypothetical protein
MPQEHWLSLPKIGGLLVALPLVHVVLGQLPEYHVPAGNSRQ